MVMTRSWPTKDVHQWIVLDYSFFVSGLVCGGKVIVRPSYAVGTVICSGDPPDVATAL